MPSIDEGEEAARHAQKSSDTIRDLSKSAVDDFGATSDYRTVAVLLIRWADWLDPRLHTVPEVRSAPTMHEIAPQLIETCRLTSFNGSSTLR